MRKNEDMMVVITETVEPGETERESNYGDDVVDVGEFGDQHGFSDERRELSRSFFTERGEFGRLERFGRRGGAIG